MRGSLRRWMIWKRPEYRGSELKLEITTKLLFSTFDWCFLYHTTGYTNASIQGQTMEIGVHSMYLDKDLTGRCSESDGGINCS